MYQRVSGARRATASCASTLQKSRQPAETEAVNRPVQGGAGRRPMRGWGRPGNALDPLAVLLRERYPSRAELARATGLPYQSLRTWTDGLWTADRMPPVRVLAALSETIGPAEVQRTVRRAMLARADQAAGPPPLTWGQRVVLEALRGFDDDLLVTAAPHVHALIAGFKPDE